MIDQFFLYSSTHCDSRNMKSLQQNCPVSCSKKLVYLSAGLKISSYIRLHNDSMIFHLASAPLDLF